MDPNSVSVSPKEEQGIPVLVLFLLGAVVVFFVFLLWFLVQKSNKVEAPIPVTNQEVVNPTSSMRIPQVTATPTPLLTGPGQFACSAAGDCKDWDPQIQKTNCTTTFADRNCLNQCGDRTKRCKI